jgi:dienelactone hydrolase
MATKQPAPRNLAQRVGRALWRAPGAGIVFAPPRTAGFAISSYVRNRIGSTNGDTPSPRLSLALMSQVALDEALLGVMKSPRRYPTEHEYETIAAELRLALSMYGERGWLDAPTLYHRPPPPIEKFEVRRAWAYGVVYERLSWPSEYEPYDDEPGRDRWMAFKANHRAHAWIVRTKADRPWLVCLHGFGTGYPTADFFAFKARRLADELGLNLLFPVLPLHGPRKASRLAGAELMSHHLQEFVLGMAQSMWDIRRVIAWVRAQGGARVGLYGMSLGSYVASLLATLEPDLDLVVAGAPLSDIPHLFEHHSPPSVMRRAQEFGIMTGDLQQAHWVVSPLAAPPLAPRDNLYIYAGLGDRMSPPAQAQRLWTHWDKPKVLWYEGSHIAFLWSSAVNTFLDEALAENGFIDPARIRRPKSKATTNGKRITA